MIAEIIRNRLDNEDDYIYGVADLTGLLHSENGRFRYGIVVGKKLADQVIDSIKEGPTLSYYGLYKSTNSDLSALANALKKDLEKVGIAAAVIEPTVSGQNTIKYLQNPGLGLSHKMVATRAGLGWIGKTALFVSYKFGPRVRLVSLLTNDELDYCKTPVEKSECGSCTICVEKCPAKAATGELWNIHLERDRFFDPFKCRENCLELGARYISKDACVCGICVAVCPKGRKKS
jgi:epoxyqueuosine reductase